MVLSSQDNPRLLPRLLTHPRGRPWAPLPKAARNPPAWPTGISGSQLPGPVHALTVHNGARCLVSGLRDAMAFPLSPGGAVPPRPPTPQTPLPQPNQSPWVPPAQSGSCGIGNAEQKETQKLPRGESQGINFKKDVLRNQIPTSLASRHSRALPLHPK